MLPQLMARIRIECDQVVRATAGENPAVADREITGYWQLRFVTPNISTVVLLDRTDRTIVGRKDHQIAIQSRCRGHDVGCVDVPQLLTRYLIECIKAFIAAGEINALALAHHGRAGAIPTSLRVRCRYSRQTPHIDIRSPTLPTGA